MPAAFRNHLSQSVLHFLIQINKSGLSINGRRLLTLDDRQALGKWPYVGRGPLVPPSRGPHVGVPPVELNVRFSFGEITLLSLFVICDFQTAFNVNT